MLNRKLYKPTLNIDDITIYIPSTNLLTGFCGREIIAKQNGLNPKSIHDSNKICNLTTKSIKYN